VPELLDKFDAEHPAAAPNDLTWSSLPVNEGKFELSGDRESTVGDDFCSSLRDIHYLALGGGLAVERDPRRLVSNSSELTMRLFGLH